MKKPAAIVPAEATRLPWSLSKQALFDMCAGLAGLGTNESEEEITTHMCREAVVVCKIRGDRIPAGVEKAALRSIDSDPSGVD